MCAICMARDTENRIRELEAALASAEAERDEAVDLIDRWVTMASADDRGSPWFEDSQDFISRIDGKGDGE